MTHPQTLRLLQNLFKEDDSLFLSSLKVLYPDLDKWKVKARLDLDSPKLDGAMEESRKAMAQMFLDIGEALKPHNPRNYTGIETLRS